MSTFSVTTDLSRLRKRLGNVVAACEDATRPAAQAGAQVFYDRVRALELQAENNRRIADASAWSNRVAVVLDAAIRRIDDRTSTTGGVNYAKAVAEVLATMAEIERQTALADDAPADPPTPGLA